MEEQYTRTDSVRIHEKERSWWSWSPCGGPTTLHYNVQAELSTYMDSATGLLTVDAQDGVFATTSSLVWRQCKIAST